MQLKQEVQQFQSQLFTDSIKATYKTYCDTYLCFCFYPACAQ